MHAAGEDLRICLLQTGAVPRRVFDVQIAAGLVGYSYPLSLVNLVVQVLRVSLPGSETRTDWRRRPLTAGAAPLRPRRRALPARPGRPPRRRAGAAGPDGLGRGGVRRFPGRRSQNRADEERWRRLPGLHQLSRRGLEMARRLADWREDEARRQNRPLRQVMRDDLLVAIAKRQPASRRDLEALRDFNRPALLSKSQAILAVLDEARAVPDDQLPEPPQRPDDSPGASTVANLLSAALAQCCTQNQVAGSLVANVADLKHLIRWYLDGRPDRDRPALLEGWRGELCGQLLLECSRAGGPSASSTRQRVPGRRSSRPEDRSMPVYLAGNLRRCREPSELLHQLLRRVGRLDGRRADPGDRASTISSWPCAGHNFGGLVIPESAVITEKADDATARVVRATTCDRHGVKVSGCNVGGADIRTAEGVELTERRIRFAARWFGVKVCVTGRRPAGRCRRAADDRRPPPAAGRHRGRARASPWPSRPTRDRPRTPRRCSP